MIFAISLKFRLRRQEKVYMYKTALTMQTITYSLVKIPLTCKDHGYHGNEEI